MEAKVLSVKQYMKIENSTQVGDLLAVCDVLINQWLHMKNVRVLRGKDNKMFVSFPQIKVEEKGTGKFYSVVSFTDSQVKEALEFKVLEAYQRELLEGLSIEDDFQISVKLNNAEDDWIKARVTIELDGIQIRDITVRQGRNGLWVAMPQRQMNNPVSGEQEWIDLIYPANSGQRKLLAEKILDVYEVERERFSKGIGNEHEACIGKSRR